MAGTLKGKERPACPDTQAQAGSAAGQRTALTAPVTSCPCKFCMGTGPVPTLPLQPHLSAQVPVTAHDLDVPSIPIVAGSAKREGLFPLLPPCAPELRYERLPTMTISTFWFPTSPTVALGGQAPLPEKDGLWV